MTHSTDSIGLRFSKKGKDKKYKELGKKNILYRYNPETDNFERYYPTFGSRLALWGRTVGIAILVGCALFFIVFYCFDSPTEENLRMENKQLRSQYNVLNKRIENSMKVIERIKERDDNFYRVMMQMEPMSKSQRLSGLENESRYGEIEKMTDEALVRRLTRRVDFMERQLVAQVQSFDQLRETLSKEKDKLDHIPSIFPVDKKSISLASGFGYRKDPITGMPKYHSGIDIALSKGHPVYATADGEVEYSDRKAEFGNCVEIGHGYNYMSRYAHLSELLVKAGDKVKRGDIIGKAGDSGVSYGSHLHYEVRFKGESQNPINYFFMSLTPEEYTEMVRKGEDAGHLMD